MLAVLSGRVDLVYDPFASTLTLIGAKATMVLEAVPPKVGPEIPPTHAGREPPEGDPPYVSAFGRADDLPLHATPSADAEVVGRAWLGQVLRNAGCTDAGVWCDVSAIDGSIAGWAEAESLEPAGGALRAGQSVFDAAGSIPCAQGAGAPMTPCAFGVAREGAGTATVVVTKPDGVPRVLYFNDGAFTGPDTSEAGGGFESSVSREADLNFIRVDDERYEVPDAVMFGG